MPYPAKLASLDKSTIYQGLTRRHGREFGRFQQAAVVGGRTQAPLGGGPLCARDVRLEGLMSSPEVKRLNRPYIESQISSEELGLSIVRMYGVSLESSGSEQSHDRKRVVCMLHRHLNHQRLTLAAIDDVISRGRWQDWADLRRAILADRALLDKVERVCRPYASDPYAQRRHFWMHCAEEHRSAA